MTTESSPLGALSESVFAPHSIQHEVPHDRPPKRDRPRAESATVIIAQGPDVRPAANGDVVAGLLLDDAASTPRVGALRLACGAFGTMLLQLATSSGFPSQELHHRLAGPPGLALAAAVTLVFGLPGTLILLTALGAPPSFQKAWSALLRAYAQVGLLAGGFSPLVALFALTGASQGPVIALSFLAYASAGVVALTGLARRLIRSAGELCIRTFLAGAGFFAFTLTVGLYLWVKVMEVIVP